MDNSQTLQQAITAIKSGDKATGQKLLVSLVQTDPRNEYTWLWLAVTMDDPAKRRQCLERVLAINPNNGQAKQGLARLQQQLSRRPGEKLKVEPPTELVEPPPKPIPKPLPDEQSPAITNMQWIDRTQIETRLEQVLTPLPQSPPKPLSKKSLQPQKLKKLDSQNTKKCPYCAETIKAEAKVCRFCGRDLKAGKQPNQVHQPHPVVIQQTPKKKQSSLVTCLVIVGLVGLVCMCGGILSPKNSSRLPTSTPSGPPSTSGPPKPIPTVGLSSEVQSYALEVAKKGNTLGKALGDLGILLQDPRLTDDDWLTTVALQIIIVQSTHKELTEMDVPHEMMEVHTALLDATSDCNESMDYLVRGLDNVDMDAMERAIDLMQSCGQKIQEPKRLMEEYNNAHQ